MRSGVLEPRPRTLHSTPYPRTCNDRGRRCQSRRSFLRRMQMPQQEVLGRSWYLLPCTPLPFALYPLPLPPTFCTLPTTLYPCTGNNRGRRCQTRRSFLRRTQMPQQEVLGRPWYPLPCTPYFLHSSSTWPYVHTCVCIYQYQI